MIVNKVIADAVENIRDNGLVILKDCVSANSCREAIQMLELQRGATGCRHILRKRDQSGF